MKMQAKIVRAVAGTRILGESERGCVGDQPQKATLCSGTPRSFRNQTSYRTLLRLISDTAALQTASSFCVSTTPSLRHSIIPFPR